MDDVLVFGSATNANNYKRSKGIEIKQAQEVTDKATAVNKRKSFDIGGANEDGQVVVEDSEISLLNNVIIRDDPEVVYMQEDVSFYDNYYLSDVKIDDSLLTEVRKIRRIYRNYTKYMYACYIREKYLRYLEERYKIDTVLNFTDDETIVIPRDVFMPPYPIYSKNAEDYDKVMRGNYTFDEDTEFEEPSKEELEELMNSLVQLMDRDTESIKCVPGGIETFKPILEFYDDMEINHSSRYSGPTSVSITDLDALQKMIRSWHKQEAAEIEQTRNRIPFPKSEEGIRQQYMNEIAYYIADHINDKNKEVDENEMVYDEVTKKPMTRKDYQKRKVLRMFESCGWDMVKLMSQLNVGSKMERKILRNKRQNKKKARKKAANFMADIMGESIHPDDYNYSMSPDELSEYLFGNGR